MLFKRTEVALKRKKFVFTKYLGTRLLRGAFPSNWKIGKLTPENREVESPVGLFLLVDSGKTRK